MTARAMLFVILGIGAGFFGVMLLAGVGVSAWYFWPAKSPELADATPRTNAAPVEPKAKVKTAIEEPKTKDKTAVEESVKDKSTIEKPKVKDKTEPPPVVKPPVKVDVDPKNVLSISLKDPQRRVGDILFTRSERLRVGVYQYRTTNKDPTEVFELFDAATRESVARLEMPAPNYSPCPRDLGPDGKYFARGTNHVGRKFSIWELGNPEPVVANWSLEKVAIPGSPWSGFLTDFHLLENDQLLTYSGQGDIELWHIPDMQSIWKVAAPRKFLLSSPIGGVISPDRRRCAVFTGDNFRILDTQTGKLICETAPIPTQKAKVLANRSSAFSSDNAMIVANIDGIGLPSALYCYDANTGELKSRVPAIGGVNYLFARVGWFGPRHYCLSTDGGRGKCVVHRASDGTKVAELIPNEGNNTLLMGFRSPDSRLWYAAMPAGSGEAKLVATLLPAELQQDGAAAPVEFRFSGQGLIRLDVPK